MPLPKIDLPLFDITLPLSGIKTHYRPFTVREEKILLIAQQTDDIDAIMNSLQQILSNCMATTDITKLSALEAEYAFIKIRSSSVNNVIALTITDKHGKTVPISANLDEIEIAHNPEHSRLVKVSDTAAIKLSYPTLDQVAMLLKEESEAVYSDLVVNCIEQIIVNDELFDANTATRDELIEFMNGLPSKAIEALEKFFLTMPKLKLEIPYKDSAGVDGVFVIEGLKSFFR